jgi:hypothetical protein
MNIRIVLVQSIVVLALQSAPPGRAQGTAFTYQGNLNDSGVPANRSYDLAFSLFSSDHGPGQLGDTVTNSAIGITNGVFTVLLDFGPGNFSGSDCWLEIGVRTNGGNEFVILSPRQKITASPYAITAANLSGIVPGAGISGAYSNAVTFDNPSNHFAGDGFGLYNLNASGITGVLPSSLLAGNYSESVTFNNPGDMFSGSFHGDGSGLIGLNASSFQSGVVPLIHGGTGADTAAGARAILGAAASGANSDITSLSGLNTPLSLAQGGTGAGTGSNALVNLGAASLTAANTFSGVNLISNAANTFVGSFSGVGSGLSNINFTALSGTLPNSQLSGTYSGAVTFNNPVDSFNGSFTGDGSALNNLNAANISSGTLPLTRGGTGAGTAAGARASLGAAASGVNSDITALSGLSYALSIGQGGTAAGTASNALVNLGAASLTAANTFSGVNVMSNAANSFVGNFSGVGSGLSNINFTALSGTLPSSQLAGTYSGAVTFNNPSNAFSGNFAGDGSALNNLNAANISNGTLPLASGGTGAGTASNALVNLGAASLTTANTFSGINVLSNVANSFLGNFSGVGSGLSNINFTGLSGTLPNSQLAGTYSGAVFFNNPADSFLGSFTGDGSALTNLNAVNISTGTLPLTRGGTGAGTPTEARGGLGAAASGANSDITSLSGLSTPLSLAQGGTGAGTASNALVNLGGASLTAANTFSGTNVLSNAANTFVGSFSGVGSGLSNINFTGMTGTLPNSQLAGTYSGAVFFNNPADAFSGSFSGEGSGLTALNAANILNGTLPLARGGTGAGTPTEARGSLGAAASGANSDITSLSGLSTPLSLAQGGTGAGTASNALVALGAASLTAANTFSGINMMSNAANSFVGSFSGVGTGLSNINFTGLIGTLPNPQLAGTYSSAVTFNNPADSFTGSLSGNGSGVSNVNAATLAGLSASSFWQLGGNAGTSPSVNFLGTTDNQPLVLTSTAGIGINTNNPGAKTLAIYGSAGVSGTNTLEFGYDVAGKQSNAGKIGYQTLTPGSLDIVGAGTNLVSRKIKFWAEAGVTFNGTGTNALMTITNSVDEQTSMFFAAPFSTWRIGQNKPPDAPGAFDAFFIYQQSAGATRLLITSDGRVGIGTNNPVYPLHLGNGAYCTAGGQWTSVSDRNAKEDFTPIRTRDVLAKVAALPISEWRYKAEPNGVKHLGPTAQDFHASFGLGESDRAIGSVDADGVALAAIQGLNQKVEDEQDEHAALKRQLTEQSAQLVLLQKQLAAQEQQIADLRSAFKSAQSGVSISGGESPSGR